ncbi:MAG: amidohydrolase family protein [Bacteroidetes bacterium]|nr:amidohydrolase family protein [Bacteroidota bacterium]
MNQLNAIDTHVHIWNLEKVEYTWLKGDTSILNRTFELNELNPQIQAAGVTKGILVQAANNFPDTDFMLDAAEKNHWIKGVVGWLPLMDPLASAQKLANEYLKNPYIKGIRHLIHNEPDPAWQLQMDVLESLQMLAKASIPYDVVGVNIQHLNTTIAVMEKIPELKLVLDHLNAPPIATNERFGVWGERMKIAAQNPNCFAKISGLGTATGNFTGWTKDVLKPYIAFVLEHFGVDRCFCGGDWPIVLFAGNYIDTWRAYKQVLAELLDAADQEKVLSLNASHFYQL